MENNLEWYANYCHRLQRINFQRLKELKNKGIEPLYPDKKVKQYKLNEYIKHLGMATSVETFEVSLATIKAWRWGYRKPSVKQAKRIIQKTNGKLDYESIYGCPNDLS
jgi:glucose-6-phosphate 1-dehydrogenase|tara:strand:+ start:3665 stop:3988 length:324 start_codon:yes stop_codon:yes gene_type:complete